MTIEQALRRVEPWLIGLWRFHERGKPRLWCATYRWRGCYYDVSGHQTATGALDAVWRNVRRKVR